MAAISSALRVAAPLAWAFGLTLLARADVVVRAAPILGLLRGPLGLALLALGAASLLTGLAPRRVPRTVPPVVLGGIAAVFFLILGLRYASGLRVSGDEPHYLLMAQSLWQEGDLDLRDNFERADYRVYTPGPVAPHYGMARRDGRPYPAHSPGLPLILAPLWALGGRMACVAFLSLCAAGVAVLVHALARRAQGEAAPALLAWAACLGPPLAAYAFHVYTEAPSALALAAGLLLLLARAGLPGAMAAALCAAALPWLHLKMIPAAVALATIAVMRLRGRDRIAFLAVGAAAGIGYLAYYQAIFGAASPLAIYGGLPKGEGGSPLRGLAGLFLDRSFGLLPHAPVFLLALAGLLQFRGRDAWPHLLTGLAVLAPATFWRMWWGGQSPPARFLVPALPFLAVALAFRVQGPPRGLARWRWVLLALGLVVTLYTAWRPADLLLLNRQDRPTRLWTALSGAADPNRYLPSLVFPAAEETRVAILWVAAIALLLGLDGMAQKRDGMDRLFRGPGLAVALLLAIGAGVDGWARAGGGKGDEKSGEETVPLTPDS